MYSKLMHVSRKSFTLYDHLDHVHTTAVMNPSHRHCPTSESTEQNSSLLLELDGGDPLAAEEDALAAAAASVARHVEGRLVVAALHLHHKN